MPSTRVAVSRRHLLLAAASSAICFPRICRGSAQPEALGVGLVAPGFLLPAEQYASYAQLLSSLGLCAQVVPDRISSLSRPAPIAAAATCLLEASEMLARRNGLPLSAPLVLVGHSRGAKACCIAARQSRRPVAALVLLDPVDVTPFDPESVLEDLELIRVPTAVLGAARGADCAPLGSNYAEFYTSLARAEATRLLGILPSAGHTQYLDDRRRLSLDVCAAGRSSDSVVHDAAFAMTATWVAAALAGSVGTTLPSDAPGGIGSRLKLELNPAVPHGRNQETALQLARTVLAAEANDRQAACLQVLNNELKLVKWTNQ